MRRTIIIIHFVAPFIDINLSRNISRKPVHIVENTLKMHPIVGVFFVGYLPAFLILFAGLKLSNLVRRVYKEAIDLGYVKANAVFPGRPKEDTPVPLGSIYILRFHYYFAVFVVWWFRVGLWLLNLGSVAFIILMMI